MASANQPETAAGRSTISDATRRRLQDNFNHGSKNSSQGNFDYATDMFTMCVQGDPGNQIYTKQFLDNLIRKYNNNKKGSKLAAFTGVGAKGMVKKASVSKNWLGVIKAGLEVLKHNPWDISTLSAMAVACEELNFTECQLTYLRTALDVNPKDPDINRLCGKALARLGDFDQAIACWHRVEQAKPGDEEAQRAIANLAVDKTISRGQLEGATSVSVASAGKAGKDSQSSIGQLTPEQKLERAITQHPEEVSNYLELADMHARVDHFAEAEAVLKRAMDASGGDIGVREQLEDVQLRGYRHQLAIAEKRAKDEKSDAATELARKVKGEVNRQEAEIFRARTERNPSNLGLKYEFGLRLKRGGQYKEAINQFQIAVNDPKRKPTVHLELGECFQQVKQYKLAMNNYESAIASLSEREVDQRKLALYRAGVLAMGLKELDKAEKHLTELASMEFGYKDVPERLDKLARMRDKG